MKGSAKDRAEGKFHEVKGKVKESIGRSMDNPRVAIEGQEEKIKGKVQRKTGEAKKVVGK